MINFNENLIENQADLLHQNRAFLYGDAVFETIKVVDNKLLFLEDHYFRLMASMRILRMEIPMNFTMEFFEEQLLKTANANNCNTSGRIRCTVFRNYGGLYLPKTNEISFLIDAISVVNKPYILNKHIFEVDLFKDFYVSKQLLSTLKTTNKLINITSSIFASENGLDGCLLMNENKNVVEMQNGNIFMLMGKKLLTPPISEGCLNGIMRKKVIAIAKKQLDLEVLEHEISPFDLQKSDELFFTNVILGIQPITKYRKKEFSTVFSSHLRADLNTDLELI